MRHVEVRDLVGGAVLVALGLFVALYSTTHYLIGEPARMGPGFFPAALGWILVGLGLLIVLLAFRRVVHVLHPPPFAPRSLAAVAAAIVVFGLLVNRLGLVPATFALVMVAACAERPYRLRRTLLLGLFLGVLAWLIFTVGLQMTLPAFTFLE